MEAVASAKRQIPVYYLPGRKKVSDKEAPLVCHLPGRKKVSDKEANPGLLALAENDADFDHDKFFTVFAEHLRSLSSYDQDAYNLTSDAHPLDNLRVNVTVQQYEKFYETYDVKEGDTMYLAPEDRICIW